MLWTIDLQETIYFYTELLGFSCNEHNEDWSYASLHKDQVEIIIVKPNEQTPFDNPTFTGSLYLNTDDINGLWESLKDITAICQPIDDFEWGMREFAIYDNNGYILQFGQKIAEIPNAVEESVE